MAEGYEDSGWGQVSGELQNSAVPVRSLCLEGKTPEEWENQQEEEVPGWLISLLMFFSLILGPIC